MGVVIDPFIRVPDPGAGRNRTQRAARLRCDCGTVYATAIKNLAGSRASQSGGKSCGCADRRRGRKAPTFIDRTGQRYGRLVVLRLAESTVYRGKPRTYWLCRCDCGNEVTIQSSHLGDGRSTSCGCRSRGPRLEPGAAARKRVLKAYTGSARKRGLCWELSNEDFDRLTSQDCFYCGLPPSTVQVAPGSLGEFIYNGIDRKDNALGYTVENTLPCCTICNYSKMDRTFDEFMEWIGRLTAYHWFNPERTPSWRLKAVM